MESDVLLDVKLEKMAHLGDMASLDMQAKHVSLILLDNQSVNVGSQSPLEAIEELLFVLGLPLGKLFLFRLDDSLLLKLGLIVKSVDVSLLKFDLFVRDLILTGLAIDEWLIHLVLVMQCGHLEGLGSI